MRRLPARFLLASVAFVMALVVLATLSVRALRSSFSLTEALARRQIEALDTNERLDEMLFQKGYVSDYLVTRDPRWLSELDERKHAADIWLDRVLSTAVGGEQRTLARRLQLAYKAYDESRDELLTKFKAGRTGEAIRDLDDAHVRINDVLSIAHSLARASRSDLLATIAEDQSIFKRAERWIALLTVLTSILGMAFGLWVSNRIARPIYELILQVESATPGRVRVDTRNAPANEMDELTHHVRGLLGELDEQRRRLVQAEKMEAMGEIAAKLAHEILNPVAGAKAALQAVTRTTELPSETRTTLHEIDRTLSRIDTILSRLVRYARPLEPRLQTAPVAELIERAIQSSRHELTARQVEVQTAIAEMPLVQVDPNLIVQVLTNLVVNAAQASPAGSTIRVEAARSRGQLVLRVIDRGHGLPPNREKLFRPFFTTREHGNGLGLATCQNIVAEHGGVIEAKEGEGTVGAVFSVTLPQRTPEWIRDQES